MNTMMDDAYTFDFGTLKGSKDKVTYKQILYNVIMAYLKDKDTFTSKNAVEKIIQATRFNEPGIELKKEIDVIIAQLNQEREKKLEEILEEYGYFKLNLRSTKSKIKIFLYKWYWDELFARILQVLADNQLITEHNKIQKIRYKKEMDHDNEQQVTEGTVTDYYE